MTDKPLKAYAVLENDENTGAIYFARHAITARKAGANEHADGDISYVSCNRAPWADRYAETGDVPISIMVMNGWNFECASCGRRIDHDLPDAWENEISNDATPREMVKARARYKHWRPSHIIGTQLTSAFCDARCEADWQENQRLRKSAEARARVRFERIVLHRFPDAELRPDRHHVYVNYERGRYRPRQVHIAFAFPGMQIAEAVYRYHPGSSWPAESKPHYTCCRGDKEVFEAWAKTQKPAARRSAT